MMNSKEIRTEARELMKASRAFWKFLWLWMFLTLAAVGAMHVISSAMGATEMTTWFDFLAEKARHALSGIDYAVPSRRVAMAMTTATLFSAFFQLLVCGITAMAYANFFLGIARKRENGWFGEAMIGFRYPLGGAWLFFRWVFQISLWSMLFVVPGVIAAYRYSQAFYLKNDNPDWSAGKCLAESGRMMKGRKWARFSLDCSYWGPITVMCVLLMVLQVISGLVMIGGETGAAGLVTAVGGLLVLYYGIYVAVYMNLGQAVFYRELGSLPKRAE